MLVYMLWPDPARDNSVIITAPTGERLEMVVLETTPNHVRVGFIGSRSMVVDRKSVDAAKRRDGGVAREGGVD